MAAKVRRWSARLRDIFSQSPDQVRVLDPNYRRLFSKVYLQMTLSSDTKDGVFLGMLIPILIPLMLFYYTWAWAVVLRMSWAWFAVPTFGATPLTAPQAIAVCVIVQLFTARSNAAKEKPTEWWGPLAIAFIQPWLVLGVNWLIKLFFIP